MSSKDVILGRIRSALGPGIAAPEIPRDYRRGSDKPDAGLPDLGLPDLDLLVERLADYKAVVHRVTTGESGIAAAIRAILGSGTVVCPPGLPTDWLPPEIEAVVDDGLPADRIAAADAVVTGAAVAVAETGTIVLDASPDQGRRIITLLPDLHICVLRPEQVVASVPEAVARLDPRRPLTWISGPSATSDIELNRVEGVHGPRNLHVILLEAP
jgi:L-lactate dehydrogenase complex protein LldG